MDALKTQKITKHFLICPGCGSEFDGVYGTEEGYFCSKCKYDFTSELDNLWEEREVDALICDICGREISCTSENFNRMSLFKEVMCPHCNDAVKPSHIMMHSVGIFYRGKWRSRNVFLHDPLKNGLISVKSKKDKITSYVLASLAKIDEPSFRTPDPKDVQILWVNGEAIGYQSSNKHMGIPCLRQIYIRPEYRRKGYATRITEKFLDENPGEILIESPNNISLKMLEKLGLVGFTEKGVESTGRIKFIQGL